MKSETNTILSWINQKNEAHNVIVFITLKHLINLAEAKIYVSSWRGAKKISFRDFVACKSQIKKINLKQVQQDDLILYN